MFLPETQRGNPDVDDWYFIGGVTISYNIFGNNGGLGGNRGKDKLRVPKILIVLIISITVLEEWILYKICSFSF